MIGSPTLIAATIAASLLVGMLLTLLFRLKEQVGQHMRIADNRLGWLGICFLVPMMLFMFLGGVMVSSWGLFDVLILSILLGAFSIVLLGLSQDEKMVWGAAGAMGASAGMLHTAVVTSMPVAYFSDHVQAATNFGYIFVILGSLLLPLLSSVLVRRLGFRNGLLILALLSLAPVVLVVGAGRGSFATVQSAADIPALLGTGHFWLALVAAVFLSAVEVSALQWAPRYLADVGYKQGGQTLMFIAFWTIFIGARLTCATIHSNLVFSWLLLLLILLAAVVMGNMIGMFNRASGGVSFLLLAAATGPIFPTLVGWVLGEFHEQPAVAFGLIFSLGTVGRLIAEPVMSQPILVERVRLAMGITMVLALIVAVPALVLMIV